jgi:sugar (pentulose or hexulose) kinase
MIKTIITIDIGTTSIRGILFDPRGRALHIEQQHNPPEYHTDGRVEQDPKVWPRGLLSLLSGCASKAAETGAKVAGVVLTSQRSSVIPVDEGGTPFRPAIMWQDKRTADLCKSLQAEEPEVFRRTGLRISPVFSAPKMRWIRDNEPEVYRKAYKMAGIQDYLLFHATGLWRTDQSLAGRTNLLNLSSRTWDDELVRIFGLDRRILCDLIEPGAVAGGLNAKTASAAGLPSGLPVISAGGDQQCAALGLGMYSPETVVANTGTGSYLIAHAEKPVFDPEMRLSCNPSAVPGAYILEAAVLTSGSVYRWFSENFYPAGGPGGGSFETINADAEKSPPGSHGVILFPYFKGSGSPRWDPRAKGLFLNLSLSTRRADMARAVLEGIAAEIGENLDLLEKFCGPAGSVSVSGGMTSFDLYNHIQADIFNKKVVRHRFKEATALGAWMSAAKTLGFYSGYREAFEAAVSGRPPEIFSPDPPRVSLYADMMKRRDKLTRLFEAGGLFELLEPGKKIWYSSGMPDTPGTSSSIKRVGF